MGRRLLFITAHRARLELCPHMLGKELLQHRGHGARRLFLAQCVCRVSPHCDKRELFPRQLPRLLNGNGGKGTEGKPSLCRPAPLSGTIYEVKGLFAGHTDPHKKAGQIVVPHLVPPVRRFQRLNVFLGQSHSYSSLGGGIPGPLIIASRPADFLLGVPPERE